MFHDKEYVDKVLADGQNILKKSMNLESTILDLVVKKIDDK